MAMHLRGVVLPDAVQRDVYVIGSTLTFERQPDADLIFDGGYILPGLVDAHAHLQVASPLAGSPEEMARASAKAHLDAGVLALREPGAPSAEGSLGIGPDLNLPRTITAGRPLAPTGVYPGLARWVDDAALPAAAAEELSVSGVWAKIIGDMPGEDGRIRAHFSPSAIAQATELVHRAGGKMAVHAITAEVIQASIEAGVDSIEHGNFMEPDLIDGMATRGIAWVPTLIIHDGVRAILRDIGSPADEIARMDAALQKQPSMVRLAVQRHVAVLAGTDGGMVPHGLIRAEISALLACGLSGEEALGAGSWYGRRFLGLAGVEEGAPADIVAYREDPRSDPEVLRRPALCILNGRQMNETALGK